MDDLYESNRVDGYNSRWRNVVGGNDAALEMKWMKAIPFQLKDHLTTHPVVSQLSATTASNDTLTQAEGEIVSSIKAHHSPPHRTTMTTPVPTLSTNTHKGKLVSNHSSALLSAAGLAVLYRDENDDELQGEEDLDELMAAMTSFNGRL